MVKREVSSQYRSYWWPRRKGKLGAQVLRVSQRMISSSHEAAPRVLNDTEWPIPNESREFDELKGIEDTKLRYEHVDTDINGDHEIEITSASSQQRSYDSNFTIDQEAVGLERKQVAQGHLTTSIVDHVYSSTTEHPSGNHPRPLSRTIHILGSGNIGKLVAHSLAGLAEPPPITLLLHRPSLLEQWYNEGEAIELISGQNSVVRRGFSAELVGPSETELERRYPRDSENLLYSTAPAEDLIDNLIVTTKAAFTVPALLSISRRLHSGSTICFVQNGMGIIEDVSKHVFPDLANRPRYMAATTSHGVAPHDTRHFAAFHNGIGTTTLSVIPVLHSALLRMGEEQSFIRRSTTWTNSTLYMTRMMTRPTVLDVRGYPYLEFMQGQLEKLAVNCVINPLTAMFDCTNGELLYNFAATRSFRKILQEFCQVVRRLPELQGIEGLQDRFRKGLLEKRVVSIAEKTSLNTSSMLQDVRKGRKTEIDYLNGYITNRGLQLGIPCPVNSLIVQMIKAKQAIKDREIKGFIPFDGQGRKWG